MIVKSNILVHIVQMSRYMSFLANILFGLKYNLVNTYNQFHVKADRSYKNLQNSRK